MTRSRTHASDVTSNPRSHQTGDELAAPAEEQDAVNYVPGVQPVHPDHGDEKETYVSPIIAKLHLRRLFRGRQGQNVPSDAASGMEAAAAAGRGKEPPADPPDVEEKPNDENTEVKTDPEHRFDLNSDASSPPYTDYNLQNATLGDLGNTAADLHKIMMDSNKNMIAAMESQFAKQRELTDKQFAMSAASFENMRDSTTRGFLTVRDDMAEHMAKTEVMIEELHGETADIRKDIAYLDSKMIDIENAQTRRDAHEAERVGAIVESKIAESLAGKVEFKSGPLESPSRTASDDVVKALYDLLKGGTASAKSLPSTPSSGGSFTSDVVLSFMKAATARGMPESAIITPQMALRAKPSAASKQEIKHFYAQFDDSVLLRDFVDGMSHHEFLAARSKLFTKVAAQCYLAAEMDGCEVTEEHAAHASRYLVSSLEYFKSKSGYNTLRSVYNLVEGSAGGVSMVPPVKIQEFMDERFASSSQMTIDMQLNTEMHKMSPSAGMLPSEICTNMQTVMRRRFGTDAHDLVESQTKIELQKTLAAVHKKNADVGNTFLGRFCDKLLDGDFQSKSLANWAEQFRIYEQEAAFKDGLAAAVALEAAKPAKKVTFEPKGARANPIVINNVEDDAVSKINVLLGLHPREFSAAKDKDALLKGIAGTLAGGFPEDMRGDDSMDKDGAVGDDGPDFEFLKRLIAAVQSKPESAGDDSEMARLQNLVAAVQKSRQEADAQWVKDHGVAGYSPPHAKDRDPLHVGRVCQAAGIPIPAGCPKDPKSMVGKECPCAAKRGIADSMWFWHAMSNEFKSGKPGADRVPPTDGTKFGYYHGLGKCPYIREIAHVTARADPTKVSLLEPLPRGSTDCITVA